MGLRNNLGLFMSWANEGFDQSLLLAKIFSSVHIVHTYFFMLALTEGPSMLPTLNLTSTLVLAERLSPRFNKVGTGDVVIVRSPVFPRKVVTKRVLGVGGDRVTYVVDPKNSDKSETVVVPKGHVWIEGDNIYKSTDSRNFGAVPYGLVEARIFWKIWPPKEFGPLEKRAE